MEMNEKEFETTLRATLDGYALARAQLQQITQAYQMLQQENADLKKSLEVLEDAAKKKKPARKRATKK